MIVEPDDKDVEEFDERLFEIFRNLYLKNSMSFFKIMI